MFMSSWICLRGHRLLIISHRVKGCHFNCTMLLQRKYVLSGHLTKWSLSIRSLFCHHGWKARNHVLRRRSERHRGIFYGCIICRRLCCFGLCRWQSKVSGLRDSCFRLLLREVGSRLWGISSRQAKSKEGKIYRHQYLQLLQPFILF